MGTARHSGSAASTPVQKVISAAPMPSSSRRNSGVNACKWPQAVISMQVLQQNSSRMIRQSCSATEARARLGRARITAGPRGAARPYASRLLSERPSIVAPQRAAAKASGGTRLDKTQQRASAWLAGGAVGGRARRNADHAGSAAALAAAATGCSGRQGGPRPSAVRRRLHGGTGRAGARGHRRAAGWGGQAATRHLSRGGAVGGAGGPGGARVRAAADPGRRPLARRGAGNREARAAGTGGADR